MSVNVAMTSSELLTRDEFLSAAMGKDAYRLDVAVLKANASQPVPNIPFDELGRAGAFIYAKLPTTDHHAISALEARGFHLVDTNVVFEKQLAGCAAALSLCEIRSALPEDEQAVVALARNGFSFSRFHLDPHVQNNVADRIKAQWLENYFNGRRGDELLLAEADGCIAGFNLLLIDDGGVVVIDLIAVEKRFQRRGIGKALIGAAEGWRPDADLLRVGTQIANVGSCRLYENCGMHLADASYVFHYHGR